MLQQLLTCVETTPPLRRLAQIVAWTEGMAQQVWEGGGPWRQRPDLEGSYFGNSVLLWQETLLRARTSKGERLPLDPDAAIRCVLVCPLTTPSFFCNRCALLCLTSTGAPDLCLSPSRTFSSRAQALAAPRTTKVLDQKHATKRSPRARRHSRQGVATGDIHEEERLLRRLFLLLRAGYHAEALELAERAGAAWRAASLAGGGFGHLPVAAAPDAAVAAAAGDADAAAADVLSGQGAAFAARYGADPCGVRARWRAACAAVVRGAAAAADAGGAAAAAEAALRRWEAALYGALAGSVTDVLPACGCWEDAVWARARAWLQVLPEDVLRGGTAGGAPAGKRRKPWHGAALAGGGAAAVRSPAGPAVDRAGTEFLVRRYQSLVSDPIPSLYESWCADSRAHECS